MDKEEKKIEKKLNYNEALKLLNELRVLEGKSHMKSGFIINKFFAIPNDYYLECENRIGFENLWNEKYHNVNRDSYYDIVALHRMELGVFWKSNDVEYFKELLYQHRNNK